VIEEVRLQSGEFRSERLEPKVLAALQAFKNTSKTYATSGRKQVDGPLLDALSGATADAAQGAAAGARWLTKAIASNMHDHRGPQQKRQRAKQWILMVYLRR